MSDRLTQVAFDALLDALATEYPEGEGIDPSIQLEVLLALSIVAKKLNLEVNFPNGAIEAAQ